MGLTVDAKMLVMKYSNKLTVPRRNEVMDLCHILSDIYSPSNH